MESLPASSPTSSGYPGYPGYPGVSKLDQASAKMQRLKLLVRRRWWILLLTASIGTFYQAWKIQGEPPVYESAGRLLVGGFTVEVEGTRIQEDMGNFLGTQQQIIESGKVREMARTILQLEHPDLKPAPVHINVLTRKGSSIITVVGSGENEKYTGLYTDAILNGYIRYREDEKLKSSRASVSAISAVIGRYEDSINDAQRELDEFDETRNIIALEKEGNAAAEIAAELRRSKARLEQELNYLETLSLDQNVNRRLSDAAAPPEAGGDGDARLSIFAGPEAAFREAQQELEILRGKQEMLARSLRPQHPDMRAMDRRLEEQQRLIEIHKEQVLEYYDERREAIRLQIAHLDSEIAEQDRQAESIGKDLRQYEELKAKLARSVNIREEMVAALRDLDIGETVQQDRVSIMEHAGPAALRDPRKVQRLATGALVGLLIGSAFLFLLDRLDDRINSFAEYAVHFTEDVLAQIPQQQQRTKGARLPILHPNDERHLYAEAFRNLRSSILFKPWEPAPPKTLLITSAVPAEGKTTIAGNLAVTMALSGAKVLLVDGDLRRGSLHEPFGASNDQGFSEVIRGDVPWKSAVQPTSFASLWFMARGESDDHASERFFSPPTRQFLEEVRNHFDYVVFDSAPVLVADDTSTFAPMIDTTFFVIRMSSTLARLSGKALDQLYDRQVRVGGIILNQASTNLKEYTYYGYANYYYAKRRPEAELGEADVVDEERVRPERRLKAG